MKSMKVCAKGTCVLSVLGSICVSVCEITSMK